MCQCFISFTTGTHYWSKFSVNTFVFYLKLFWYYFHFYLSICFCKVTVFLLEYSLWLLSRPLIILAYHSLRYSNSPLHSGKLGEISDIWDFIHLYIWFVSISEWFKRHLHIQWKLKYLSLLIHISTENKHVKLQSQDLLLKK